MSYKYSFKNYKTAEKYLDSFSGKPIQRLNINEKMLFKENLKNNHNKEQLKILQSLIESELKVRENFSPKNLIFSIVITPIITFIATMVMFVPQAIANILSTGNSAFLTTKIERIKIGLTAKKISVDEAIKSLNEIEKNISNRNQSYSDMVSDFVFNQGAFRFLSIVVMGGLIAIAISYNFDSKVEKLSLYKNLISQCLDEKPKYLN